MYWVAFLMSTMQTTKKPQHSTPPTDWEKLVYKESSHGQMVKEAHEQSQATGFTCCGFWHACLHA